MSMRAKKAGDSALTERKIEKKYEEEEANGTQQRIMEWINEVLKGEHPPCPSSSFRDLHNYLRDGVVLCKLMNKLLNHDQKGTQKFKARANSRFMAAANTETFLNGCKAYGVNENCLCSCDTLWEGQKGPFLSVINTINGLGMVANQKGFHPQYETIVPLLPE